MSSTTSKNYISAADVNGDPDGNGSIEVLARVGAMSTTRKLWLCRRKKGTKATMLVTVQNDPDDDSKCLAVLGVVHLAPNDVITMIIALAKAAA